jgi:hypothetical protein
MKIMVGIFFLFLTTSSSLTINAQKLAKISMTASWIAHETAFKFLAQQNLKFKGKSQEISKMRALYAGIATETPKSAWLAAKAARISWNKVRNLPSSSPVLYTTAYSSAFDILTNDSHIYPYLEHSFGFLMFDHLRADYLKLLYSDNETPDK